MKDLEVQSGRNRLLLRVPGLRKVLGGAGEELLRDELEEAEERLEVLREKFGEELDFESYLTSRKSSELEEKAEKVFEVLERIDSRAWSFPVEREHEDRFEEVKEGLEDCLESLRVYNEVFVDEEIERFDHLFEGDFELNWGQREAVVRNDDINQVVAGPGTGKTLVLIYRIAYLVEKGVDPERILAFTLTNKACEEIEDRLEGIGVEGVEVRTFHSFGYSLIDEALEERKTIVDGSDKRRFVRDFIDESAGIEFGRNFRRFLSLKDSDLSSRQDFESEREFIESRAEKDYETINGEEVESRAEKVIADFLFTHGIDYRYEALAEWADNGEEKRNYRPDFYLPEHGIYIEHWGVIDGEVADWFSWDTGKYKEKMEWGRQQFSDSDYTLVETFEGEYRDEDLEAVLMERLIKKGVEPEPLEMEEIVENSAEKGLERTGKEFVDFLETAKTFDVSPEDLESRLEDVENEKYYFGVCGKILLEEYREWLESNGYVDFQGLMYKAIEELRDSEEVFYDHVLVDEFQDVALSQVEMVRQLTRQDAKLFCVGDDWQSIYGFRGAVVDYFVNFEDYFGEATVTKLRKNYRSTPEIIRASDRLISENPSQIEKQLETVKESGKKPRIHTISGKNKRKYRKNLAQRTAELAKKYIDSGSDPEEVMVLSRLSSATDITDKVEKALKDQGIPVEGKLEDGVKVLSAHSSKGKEARHVIIVHAVEGHEGFSPETEETGLLNVARDVKVDTEAEERRLFYVALTRAEETVDILTRKDRESPFLREISGEMEKVRSLSDPGEPGEEVDVVAMVDRLWDTGEKVSQAGLLKDSTGSINFVAWKDTSSDLDIKQRYIFRDLKVTLDQEGEKELEFTEDTEVEELVE